jgi:beta-lactamase regulating signal transducer with metallopeptidase domain
MTILATLGWAVVHSLWQGTFIAGLTAMTLSLLRDRHARVRELVACASLAVMVIAPLATAIGGADILDPPTRRQALSLINGAVTLPTIVRWRAILVPGAAALWTAGFIICLLRIAGEWRRARALRPRDRDEAGEDVRAVVAELRASLSVTGGVDVFGSAVATVPMVLGWRRPVILLPARSMDELDADQLRAVLAHELAHVRRFDYLANLLQLAADALLFHHPAARWVSRRIRIEREYCCDDVAVMTGRDRCGYARALAALEDARADCRPAVAAASGTLLDRIQRIVGHPRRTLTPAQGALALVTASVLAAVMLGFAAVVPPSLPLDASLRMRTPAPPGSVPRASRGDLLPRTRRPPADETMRGQGR